MIFHCVNISDYLYSLTCCWTIGLFPNRGYFSLHITKTVKCYKCKGFKNIILTRNKKMKIKILFFLVTDISCFEFISVLEIILPTVQELRRFLEHGTFTINLKIFQ